MLHRNKTRCTSKYFWCMLNLIRSRVGKYECKTQGFDQAFLSLEAGQIPGFERIHAINTRKCHQIRATYVGFC